MTLLAILSDGFFAAVAAVGFGAVSDPPMRAFPAIALLAAVGHALRFCLMDTGVDIASASLCASVAIGIGSLLLGGRIHCPMTVLFIPALLPMIPGMYAYKTVFSMIMFMQNLDDPSAAGYLAAIGLSFFVPRIFTAIAFDSGGVASGPMTATFLLPFAMGACQALGGNVITDAFGVVAMVAMTPLLTIQLLGLVYQWKLRKAGGPEAAVPEEEIIEL